MASSGERNEKQSEQLKERYDEAGTSREAGERLGI